MVIVSVVNMIIVFTGDGKGKTTAALGVVLRALGYGKRVCVVQFFKSWPTGEQKMLEELSRTKPLKFYSFGEKDFISSSKNLAKAKKVVKKVKVIDSKEKLIVEKALETAEGLLREKPFLIVLDEVNIAVHMKLLSEKRLLDFIKRVPKGTNVILTGRCAPESVIKVADLVSEVKKVKHPFDKGVLALKGIDF